MPPATSPLVARRRPVASISRSPAPPSGQCQLTRRPTARTFLLAPCRPIRGGIGHRTLTGRPQPVFVSTPLGAQSPFRERPHGHQRRSNRDRLLGTPTRTAPRSPTACSPLELWSDSHTLQFAVDVDPALAQRAPRSKWRLFAKVGEYAVSGPSVEASRRTGMPLHHSVRDVDICAGRPRTTAPIGLAERTLSFRLVLSAVARIRYATSEIGLSRVAKLQGRVLACPRSRSKNLSWDLDEVKTPFKPARGGSIFVPPPSSKPQRAFKRLDAIRDTDGSASSNRPWADWSG